MKVPVLAELAYPYPKLRVYSDLDVIVDLRSFGTVVEVYRGLKVVEGDFRCPKAIDLSLRPVRHYLEDRVRAHGFIAMLVAYLVWHLRRAVAPLCFTDEDPRAGPTLSLPRHPRPPRS